jgi:hypothetical protein
MKKHHIEPLTVADATATLAALEKKRDELLVTAAELAEAKKAASFAAHTTGSAELVNVQRSVRANAADIESIGEAIHEAANRVLIAKAFEREAADKANAERILEVCTELEKAGNSLGAAARTFSETSRQVSGLLAQLNSYGISSPSAEQYRVFGSAATRTMLAGSFWARSFPPVAPLERKTFDSLISGWVQSIRARIRGRVKDAA